MNKIKKYQKGFIQIPILIAIIIGGLVVVGGSYFGYTQFKNYQIQQTEKEKQSLILIEKQNKALEETNATLEKLKSENQKIKSQQELIISEQQKENLDLAKIIDLWKPYVAYIECDFNYTNGVGYLTQTGSGFILATRDPPMLVFTNRHVIIKDNKYTPKLCRVFVPNDKNYSVVSYENDMFADTRGYDFGFIKIENPSNYFLQDLVNSELSRYQDYVLCDQKPLIGDEIVILGYPGIGSQTDVTATSGIISGYDGDYYITDAKVEHGNSGGVAILVKDNCYLGIPTFVSIGSIESLARILDLHATGLK